MNKIILRFVISIFIPTVVFAEVEHSVIPMMEYYECIENLPSTKFTKNQFSEICSALEKKEEKIRIVTYNMLFDLYDHNLDEENRWPSRLPRIVELINEMRPDIICTQELYPSQVQDIVNLIGEEFSFFNGQKYEDGESFGIFYRNARFKLLSSKLAYPLSVVQLKDLKTDKIIHVFNTHMPFSNIEKREAHAYNIAEIIEPYAEQTAVIFTGDLNTFPGRLDLDDLPFYDGDHIHRILSKGCLKNSRDLSLLGHLGPISTFTNKSPEIKPFQGTGTPGIILDYIYVSKKVTVLTHAVEQGTVNGHFPSDHMPVLIDCLIQ